MSIIDKYLPYMALGYAVFLTLVGLYFIFITQKKVDSGKMTDKEYSFISDMYSLSVANVFILAIYTVVL